MPGKRITLTLPPDLFEAVEAAASRAQLSRAEWIRGALRQYFAGPRLPAGLVDQMEDDLELDDPRAVRDIARARREARNGETRDAGLLLAELEESTAE